MSIVQVPAFEINLDLPPQERFLEVFVNYQENIKTVFTQFYESIPEARREFFVTLTETLRKLNYEYYMELDSLSKIIEMDLHKCIAVDHICEAVTGCTSIISKMIDEATGRVKLIHGRNLDYPVAVATMRNSLYKAVYKKNGQELCTGKDIFKIFFLRFWEIL